MNRCLVTVALTLATAVFGLPAPRVERAVPFRVGETLVYDVSWEAYLTAGTMVATVKEKKPSYSSTAYYIVVEGRPTLLLSKLYSLYYKTDTLLDSYTLLSQRGATYSEEGQRHRYHATRFDRAARRAFFEDERGGVRFDFAVPPAVQDPLSALYVLRANPLKAGARLTIPISENGTIYQVQVQADGLEGVRTPAAETNALKVNAAILDVNDRPLGQNIVIWFSEDPRRLPMKIQAEMPFGTFNLVLREAR